MSPINSQFSLLFDHLSFNDCTFLDCKVWGIGKLFALLDFNTCLHPSLQNSTTSQLMLLLALKEQLVINKCGCVLEKCDENQNFYKGC